MMFRTRIARAAAAACIFLLGAAAHAGGMYLPGRGARALGRAGSFVAGADDAGALYYNPAGLAEIDGVSTLLDLGFVLQRVHYDRVDSGGNRQPGVDGSMDVLPTPTLGLTWKPKRLPQFTFAGGIWAPYTGLNSYPEKGPQRYSLISLNGSVIAVGELAAALRVNEHFLVGAGFELMIIRFRNFSVLSACTQLNCAPEDPSFDAPTTLTALGAAPSGILGASIVYPRLRGGVSLQLPFWVNADATIRSRLPTDPQFANATIRGDQANVSLRFPLTLRLGVEYRPIDALRIELGFDYEAWSLQDSFAITPKGVVIDVPGQVSYRLNTIYVTRGLQDTFSIHLGGEYEIPQLARRLIVRAGYLYESAAAPDQTLSVLTPDGQRHMIAVGVGGRVWKLRLDLGYAHVFTPDRTVSGSQWYQLNPIQPAIKVGVASGHYAIDADILSIGVDGRF